MVTLKFRALCRKCRERAYFDLEDIDDEVILEHEYPCPVTGFGHYLNEDVIVEVSINGGKWEEVRGG